MGGRSAFRGSHFTVAYSKVAQLAEIGHLILSADREIDFIRPRRVQVAKPGQRDPDSASGGGAPLYTRICAG
jgi:hypothetical protein